MVQRSGTLRIYTGSWMSKETHEKVVLEGCKVAGGLFGVGLQLDEVSPVRTVSGLPGSNGRYRLDRQPDRQTGRDEKTDTSFSFAFSASSEALFCSTRNTVRVRGVGCKEEGGLGKEGAEMSSPRFSVRTHQAVGFLPCFKEKGLLLLGLLPLGGD